MLKIGSLRVILNLDQNYLFLSFWPQMTLIYLRGHFFLPGITLGYHMNIYAKNWVPRPYRLPVIEKYHVCYGQTNRQTDRQTDTQTENRHKLFLSLTFIDMTHINILIVRHLVKIFHTDRQRKFNIWYGIFAA